MEKQSEKKSAKTLSLDRKKNQTTARRKDAGKVKEEKQKTFKEYANFIGLPTNEQQELYGYTTDLAFAAEYKVSNRTLQNWKHNDELWKQRDVALAGARRYTPYIMEAMRIGAMKGDTAAAKLHLQFIEKWNPKVEVGASIELIGGEEDFG